MTKPRSPWPSPACPPAGTEGHQRPLAPATGGLDLPGHASLISSILPIVNVFSVLWQAGPQSSGVFTSLLRTLQPRPFLDTYPF